MHAWRTILDVVILLGGAALLGLLAERLRQSAIVGYLVAGMLLGPGALDVVAAQGFVEAAAELGVALLLFTIGLEFSWRELRGFGAPRLLAGVLQVVVTVGAAAGVASLFGLSSAGAVAVGALLALSSTACVLGVLRERAELDSLHGRQALAMLLVQDVAVVPLVVIVTALGGRGSAASVVQSLAVSVGLAAILIAAFHVLSSHAMPRLLGASTASGNRDLPILVTVTTCLAASWAANATGLPPSLGALVAGVLLAGSPFATRVRADVAALRTLFVTTFFASIGMLARPSWIVAHAWPVALTVAGIVVGKTLVTWAVGRAVGQRSAPSLASAICLAQVGEFSFVLASTAVAGGLLDADLSRLLLTATVGTLLVTPYLVAVAPHVAAAVHRLRRRNVALPAAEAETAERPAPLRDHVVVVGGGPAGKGAAAALDGTGIPAVIIEMNQRSVERAVREGLRAEVGDGASEEGLEHVGLRQARALVVTIPDLRVALQVAGVARIVAPHVPVVARSRYHVHALHLVAAGASVVVDEEHEVGVRLGVEVRRLLHVEGPEAPLDET